MPETRLSNSHLELIKRIAEPVTVSDFFLALQIPYSAVFKEFMNKIATGEQIVDIIEHMLIKLVNREFIANEQEKEAILQYVMSMQQIEDEKRKMRADVQPTIYVNDDMLSKYKIDELRQRLDERADSILILSKRNDELNDKLTSLNSAADKNNKDWDEHTKNSIDTFVTAMAENRIPLNLTKNDIAEVFNAPAPLKVLEIVGDSHKRASGIPNAPPPPGFRSPPVMAAQAEAFKLIRLAGKCVGNNESGVEVLHAALKNKAAMKLIPKAKVDIFKTAIDIYQEKSDVKQELSENSHKITQKQNLQSLEQQIYDKLVSRSFTPKP